MHRNGFCKDQKKGIYYQVHTGSYSSTTAKKLLNNIGVQEFQRRNAQV